MPSTNLSSQLSKLQKAKTPSQRRSTVHSLIQKLGQRSRPAPLKTAGDLLFTLRDQRSFKELVDLAQAILESGQTHPLIRRLHAQGLIETGRLEEALETLKDAASDLQEMLDERVEPEDVHQKLFLRNERSEVEGLRGRAYKQHYLQLGPNTEHPRTEEALEAMKYYRDMYFEDRDRNLWHGINYVALMSHQGRLDPLAEKEFQPKIKRLSREILNTLEYLEETGDFGVWDQATRTEAYLALGEFSAARDALEVYLKQETLSPFMLGSMRRQMQEVWHLSQDAPEAKALLTLLARRSSELEDRDARKEPPEPEEPEKDLEKLSMTSTDIGANLRARSVARLGRQYEFGDGTGFVLFENQIWPESEKEVVYLLTNAHVCSHLERELAHPDSPCLDPEDLRVLFIETRKGRSANLRIDFVEVVWSSARDELDASLLALWGRPVSLIPYKVNDEPPAGGEKASIIGFPFGGAKIFSESQNIDQVDDKYFYYATETKPGNSGSPVFNKVWRLIGLHRGSDKEKGLRYGVRIDRILEKLRQDQPQPPPSVF